MSRLIDLAASAAAISDVEALRDDEVVALVRDLGELRRLVEARLARAAAALDRRCVSGASDTPAIRRGYRTPELLVAAEAQVEPVTAHALTRVGGAVSERLSFSGETLPASLPHVADALAAGTLSLAAADRIVRTVETVATFTAPEQIDRIEATLVTVAPQVTARELRAACARVVDLIDPDGVEPREDDLRQRSSLTIHELDDGMTRIVALLHPQAASFVRTALDARTGPRRSPSFSGDALLTSVDPMVDAEDRRTLAQKRADALAGIASDALALDTGSVAGAPVTVLVTMTLEQLQGAGGAAHLAGVDQAISAGTARRMAASAELIPLVLGGESEILDQGRGARLATPAQRRALAHRDRGCIWGCGAPPGWCEVAHRIPWVEGGATDLDDLALMCSFHHRVFDTEGWALEWRDRIPWLIPPRHVDPARTPRRAGSVPAIA